MNKCILQTLSLFLLPAALSAATPVDFVHRVAPILKTHCSDCHMAEKKKGGLSLNTFTDLQAGS
jgi:mono/diheme cytochrome c family protein